MAFHIFQYKISVITGLRHPIKKILTDLESAHQDGQFDTNEPKKYARATKKASARPLSSSYLNSDMIF